MQKKQLHNKLDLACPQCWCLPSINLCCTKLTKGAVHQLCSATSPHRGNEVNTRKPKETQQVNLLHPLIWDCRAPNNCRLTAVQTLGKQIAVWKIDSAFILYNWNNCVVLWLLHLLPCVNTTQKHFIFLSTFPWQPDSTCSEEGMCFSMLPRGSSRMPVPREYTRAQNPSGFFSFASTK